MCTCSPHTSIVFFCITISVGNPTLKSAEVILMVAFGEKNICDVKLHDQILPACRFLKVSSVRGKPKPVVSKLLAQTLINQNYVLVNDPAKYENLTLSDVDLSSERDIKEDVKGWLKSFRFGYNASNAFQKDP